MRRETEYWKDVKFNTNYEVSSIGRVRNKRNGHILSQHPNREQGYMRVTIGGKHHYVHRLVADSFIEGDHSNRDVNHMDGNKQNNDISNLEWVSRRQNICHAFNEGLRYPVVKNVVRCKFCRNRYRYDICVGKSDSFYCAFGKR